MMNFTSNYYLSKGQSAHMEANISSSHQLAANVGFSRDISFGSAIK